MRPEKAPPVLMLALLACVGSACQPGEPGASVEEPLETEDIGGAIDAELSTEGDVRGPRRVESQQVLPAGFPAELPLIGDLKVVGSGSSRDDRSYAILETSIAPDRITSEWRSLLAQEGWQVESLGGTRFKTSRAGVAVEVGVTPAGTGSRLRIEYR